MARPKGGKNKASRKVEIQCDYCKKTYLTYPCRLKRKYKHHYCNYKCMGLANRGREYKKATRLKLSKHMKRLWEEGILKTKKPWNKGKVGVMPVPWNKGTKGVMKAWNEGLIGYKAGEEHYNWKGGKSFEPYGLDFNNALKLEIIKRDNFKCRECDWTEKRLGYKLHVHHIDYNKENNDPNNLISLCRNCHMKTNFQREDWTNYFRTKVR